MKYSRLQLLRAKGNQISFDEMISFDESAFTKMDHIRGLHDVAVSGNIHYDVNAERVNADLDIEGVMILPCSLTLEDVEYPFATSSSEVFSFVKCDDAEVHECKGDVVELLPVIFQLILFERPLKVVKEGAYQYPKGNGWEVMREEDYVRTKEEERPIDPRLAKLKDFKLED